MCVFEEDSTSSNTERIPFRSSIMPNEIFDNLFLGQCPMGNTLFFIKELKITHILNCALECNYETPPNVVMKKIRINDETTETIPFDEVISFIDNALNEKESGKHVRVFVHCQMGISRSASVVAAWLMSHFGIDVDTALSVVKKQRIIVRPNDGFLRQLILYDRKLEKERKHQKETSLKEEDFVQRVDCSADADVTEVILKHEGKDDEQSPASSSAQPSNIESEGKSEVTKFTSLELPKFSAPLFDALKRIKAEIDREEKQKALVKASDELEQKS
ncbi:putative protein phosphatase slingshot [Monocercomonoides exilis]|uniref:putative protein phosphatase slingshot n=1 Tax=Monocercomonoides exilis TaxID=2049356 RepID=UPI0035597167|nr:putative protein phosphatase slingshot [Monocercomonoides exilis]|eukprot:MONOS_2101.1-p1 / transcript=MONOS_2101.1 / gene=MONOS_2101 / organism=Monocercomonoides_exilis_PA203 / gene_product=unspecified product / transcript_product=unspecified product / location=Mono_scaffold00041:69999-70823(-) / protein_length=274 / sequence_SO=supercontig / SO=protein_coding / is_pseudo=false